ncbi:sucrose-specific PTS transporter subunit IIBC [Limosilactobacillus secaliphilus]|uniref:protein-N(pi)-phosphohistidine--sucrose phosphotransferase n=1 Tax=Limosilactobacillus secaliphilus TaxID=396268 RepID=A0A0R2HZL6_9LACO|nr:sucrose-specific PTS transporter subunit IIBC [Limosilactobacillus secaliphilus]KRN58322.1 PTS system sucrose-specific IIABC component [Limosilactobacillus secaliphilus]
MDHKRVATTVIKAVGKNNIVAAAHCATRLRLVLKDEKAVNQKLLDQDDDIKGTFKTNGQYQIIIGPGDVNNVYDEMIAQTGLKQVSTQDLKQIAAKNQKTNPVMAFIKLLSDIFVPLIPALVAGGLLMALDNVLTAQNLFGPKSVIQMMPALKGIEGMVNVMSAAPYVFLPILVGISAAKRFGANQFLGAVVGMMMTAPALAKGGFWNIFGLQIHIQSYVNQVIPALAAVWILSIFEKWFHKHLPQAVDFTFTPLLSVLITGFLTFVIVGPVMKELSDLLTNGIVWLYDTLGFIGTGIFGAVYSPIVLTGLHQSFPAIETQLVTAFKAGKGAGDFIFVVASMANVAQGAATTAVYFLTKNKKMKALSSSSAISALLGITEPAIFGVNLKLKFPFFCALVGSCVASTLAGLLHVVAASMGSAGFIGFISIYAKCIPFYLLCELVSFVVAFLVTYFYGKSHNDLVNPVAESAGAADAVAQASESAKSLDQASKPEKTTASETVVSPVAGQAEDLSQVKDEVFSQKMMGDGAAVVPSDGTIYAPVDGEITVAYATKHAYGLTSKDGAEVLIHIGLDTVNLKGQHFESFVEQGQKVKRGDKLGTIDLDAVKKAGYDTTVMVVITNTNKYAAVKRVADGQVNHGDSLIALTSK